MKVKLQLIQVFRVEREIEAEAEDEIEAIQPATTDEIDLPGFEDPHCQASQDMQNEDSKPAASP